MPKAKAQTPAAEGPSQDPAPAAAAAQVVAEAGEHQRRTLAVVAEQLREYLRTNARELEFHVDTATDTTVITIRDAAGAVVRQIPNAEALRFQRFLNARSGTFLDLFV